MDTFAGSFLAFIFSLTAIIYFIVLIVQIFGIESNTRATRQLLEEILKELKKPEYTRG